LQNAVLEMIDSRLLSSAHDTSEGGLAICLAEKSIASDCLGCRVNIGNSAGELFGESQSRIVVSIHPQKVNDFIDICNKFGVGYFQLGQVCFNDFIIENFLETSYSELKQVYESSIEEIILRK